MADNVEQLEARRWIDSLEDKWRLQILSKRQRLNLRTGERKDMPTRIRRFAEGIPWAYVAEGIRYLISKAPYRGIMFNGVRLDEEYRPTLTLWQRDAQDTVNSPVQRGGDSTYTLIQDLIAVDEEDLYGAVTSASCSEEVVSEWHWDEAQPGDIPQPTQGVTWQIAQVNRKEDGTFDYALIKRTALTQHTGETIVKDTTAELVRADSWNNVYTDDQGRYTDNYGNLLDIPESHYGDGVACEVTRQINDDCTFRVNAQWTESKDATVRESCQKTQFEHEHSVSKVGQEEPLGEAPEASGGVVKRHEDQLQPDGKYSTVENTQTELPVEKARVRVTVGRRGRRVERTDRNQPVPASTEGLDIGQSVEVEKTPGKLYNNTTVNFDLSEKQRVAESCEIDLFKHDHSETVAGVDEIPGIDEHVEGSGQNGDVKTRRTEMDDEGSVSQTNAVHHEKEVLKHRETWQVGLRGVRHSVTDTQTSPANVPPPPSYSKENIGKSVSVEKTPGGLVNITTEDVARETPLDAGEGCGKTVFEHRDTTITNDPDGSFVGHVPDAGDGKYYENQSRLNEDGTSTVEQTEHKELEYPASEVEIRRTAKAVYRTTTDKNVKRTAQEPEGIGTSRHTTNPGGTHDVTTTTVDILNLPDRAHCAQTVFEHQHDKVEVSKGAQADNSDTPKAGGGHHFSKESSVDDMGVVTTVLRDTEELEKKTAAHSKRKSRYGVVETVTDRNTTDSSVEVENIGDEVRVEMTPGGRYNRTVTTAAREDLGTVARACEKNVFQETDSTTENKKDDPGKQHAEAGDGKYGSKSARMTDMGTWDVTDTTTTETEQGWTYDQRKTLRGLRITTIKRNTADNSTDTPNVGDEVHLEMTPGGRYNRTETKLSVVPGLPIRDAYTDSHLEHTELHTRVEAASIAARDDSLEIGERTGSDSRQNDDGTWDNTNNIATGQAQALSITYQSREQTATYKWWVNQRPGYSQEVASGFVAARSNSINARINDFGLEDGSSSSSPAGSGNGGGEDVVSWGWNMREAAHVTIRTTINHSYGPCTYELAATRFYAEGLWRHYWEAFKAWKRLLTDSSENAWAKQYDLSRLTFSPFTLASGTKCYRISFMSPPKPEGEWKKVTTPEKKKG